MSISQVLTSPMGVVPARISKAAGAPPHTIGEPGLASWPITTPLKLSAAWWTTAAARVTGDVAPAKGMETSCAGTPFLAQSIRFWQVKLLHNKGGGGET